MNLINISDLYVNYSERDLLNHVSLGINESDKIGIIGVNGCGKSSLLKMIAGISEEYTGEIIRARGITIAYLSQTPDFDENESIIEYVSKGGYSGETWDRESEAKTILTKLGVIDFNQEIETLSGGQKKRVALARTLLQKCDVLILDEPTNHLDNDMNEWLQSYLNSYKGVLVMVTHDRYFLDMVTNKIVEIDQANLYEYNTNYEGYLKLKCERQNMDLASERKRESILRNELKWIMRGARARSTKQKSRIERFENMKDIPKIEEKQNVLMESSASRMGKKTIELHGITKKFDSHIILDDFEYIFLREERIGIIGKNGCGKSTLLNIITGNLEPDSGDVEIGETIRIGYFKQHSDSMNKNQQVIDYIRDVAEYLPTKNGKITASQMLERFLFTPKMQYSLIGKLSGGEMRRLYLLKVLMSAPNVLILDEPTNDLDIMTLTILEDYLDSFEGIVIVVSHDRYFLDRVVNRILSFEEQGRIREYMGGYTDYYNHTQFEKDDTNNVIEKSVDTIKNRNTKKNDSKIKLKFSYNEQREFDTIDSKIENLENQLKDIEEDISASASDFVKLNQLMEEKEKKTEDLDKLMDRWAYLNDLAEKMNNQ